MTETQPPELGEYSKRPWHYLCLTCKKYFELEKELDDHINEKHLNDVRKKCPFCEKRFNYQSEVRRHREMEHENEPRFFCQFCGYTFYSTQTLNNHVHSYHRQHINGGYGPRMTDKEKVGGLLDFNCQLCQKSFNSKRSLTEHNRYHHKDIEQQEEWKCKS